VHGHLAGYFLRPAQTVAEAGVAVVVAEAEGLLPPQLLTIACVPNSPSERPPCKYQ